MKHLATVLVLTFLSISSWAQPDMEQMQAIRVAYITNALDLNPTEAERFWPLHNEMSEQLRELRNQRRQLVHNFRDEEALLRAPESELRNIMNRMLELEQEEIAIRREYHTKFLDVLDVHKVALLYRTEEEFKRVLLERMRREEHPHRRRR